MKTYTARDYIAISCSTFCMFLVIGGLVFLGSPSTTSNRSKALYTKYSNFSCLNNEKAHIGFYNQ